jgi:hypothetical protein
MTRRVVLGSLLLLAVVVSLPSCGAGGGGGGGDGLFASAIPFEPTTGTWNTYLLSSPSALRPAAPPAPFDAATLADRDALVLRAAARGPTQTANIDAWNNTGTVATWINLALSFVITRKPPPPQVARILALTSVGMYDAMVASFDAKWTYLRIRPSDLPGGPVVYGGQRECPGYVSDRAAMSAAAAKVLKHFFTLDLAAIDATLQSALDADLDACVAFPLDVTAGQTLGSSVGDVVLAYAATDHGDDAQPTYTESGIAGRWFRTAQKSGATPVFPPTLPGWGIVKCWYMPSGDAIRPGAPPALGTAENSQARDYVFLVSQTLSTAEKALADFWADGGGTVTPPGHWAQIGLTSCASHLLNQCRVARAMAILNTAQADAFVACWDCKYFYDRERPITQIRREVAGQAAWMSYINTPSFPSYPSGHSSTSGAASTVLSHLFPDQADDFAQMSNDAKDSRLFGLIHYVYDNDTGLSLGRSIGTFAVNAAAHDGAE